MTPSRLYHVSDVCQAGGLGAGGWDLWFIEFFGNPGLLSENSHKILSLGIPLLCLLFELLLSMRVKVPKGPNSGRDVLAYA